MDRWRRRSRVIWFWRRALPTLIVLIAGGVLSLVLYNTLIASRRLSDQGQVIRMLSPRFLGRDKAGRPYVVTAKDAARPDPNHMELVSLTAPHLVLETLNGDPPTVVDARTGLYNENTHILMLDGNVWVDDGKKDLFRSEHATVDTDKGSVVGKTPVLATGPLGTSTGQSYSIYDRGRVTVVDGNVKTHIINN